MLKDLILSASLAVAIAGLIWAILTRPEYLKAKISVAIIAISLTVGLFFGLKEETSPAQLIHEELTIRSPKDWARDVDADAYVEVEYKNIPPNRHLWLLVRGEETDSSHDLYWPIGENPEGRKCSPRSVIDRGKDENTNIWKRPKNDDRPWFTDAGKSYSLEVIAVDESFDHSLGTMFQNECLLGAYSGVNETASPIPFDATRHRVHLTVKSK